MSTSAAGTALPKVFMIGAGPVAVNLARSLCAAGVPVLGIWARRPEAVATAAAYAQVPGFKDVQPPMAQILDAEVLILAVRDAAIAEVAQRLVVGNYLANAPVLLHCSGAVAAEVALEGARASASGLGLLHPLRAMVPGVIAESLAGTTFGVEGDAQGRLAASKLCEALGGTILSLRAEQMSAYHAAAVMASNYLMTLLDVAESLASEAGLDRESIRSGIIDLAEGALAGAREGGPVSSLTGPIRRGDEATIEAHIGAIAEHLPGAATIYSQLGHWTVAMARQCGDAAESELDDIAKLLAAQA